MEARGLFNNRAKSNQTVQIKTQTFCYLRGYEFVDLDWLLCNEREREFAGATFKSISILFSVDRSKPDPIRVPDLRGMNQKSVLLPVSDPPSPRAISGGDAPLFKGSGMTQRGAYAAVSYMSCAGKIISLSIWIPYCFDWKFHLNPNKFNIWLSSKVFSQNTYNFFLLSLCNWWN